MMRKFAHIICNKCKHVNYFIRLNFCPMCDEKYGVEIMTDQEKIEEAANEHKDGLVRLDSSINAIPLVGYHKFKAGIAWRDKNPSPHVMALVTEIKSAYSELLELGLQGKGKVPVILKDAIEQFEMTLNDPS